MEMLGYSVWTYLTCVYNAKLFSPNACTLHSPVFSVEYFCLLHITIKTWCCQILNFFLI